MSETLEPEHLLADAAWLQRLARSLADSQADADDLVQESWIAAWRRRPVNDRTLRPWLAKVVRDVAAMKRRGERRRAVREQAAELPDEVVAPDAALERMRLHRLLVDLVLELPEPYRSTVIWRFVEGRTAASIARSLGIPEATVRGRTRDALERLRAGLDARTGSRKAWAPAALAFMQHGAIVTTKTKLTTMIAGLIALLLLVVVPRVRGAEDPAAPDPQATGSAGGIKLVPGGAVAPGDPVPAWFGVEGGAARRIAGRVTYEGKPVAGAQVTLHSQLVQLGLRPAELRTTGADGTFDFGLHHPANYQVIAESPDLVAAIAMLDLADRLRKPRPEQLELRLQACRASVTGTVFDASGGFIGKARIKRDGLAGVTADDKGAYTLCVPRGQVQVDYAADGYGSVMLTLDVDGAQRQDIVLVPEATIAVRVLRAGDDTPVAGAAVFANAVEGGRDRPKVGSAVTDAGGRARLTRLVPGRYRVFGFTDTLTTQAPVAAQAEVSETPEVVLRMDATARITGVVMMNGKPVDDAQVIAIRKSPVARSQDGYTATDGTFTLERVPLGELGFAAYPYDVKSGGMKVDAARTYDKVVIEVERLGSIRGRVTRLGKPVENVGVCCVPSPASAAQRVTDADGYYEYRGVLDGAYEIGGGSDDLGAFAFGKQVTVARGEQVVVDIELDQAASISGTVVDKAGKPVPGVFVRWMHEQTGDVGRCASDAQGRYRCGAMSGGGLYRAQVFPGGSRQTPYPTADGAPYPARELANATSAIEDATIAIDYQQLSISGRVVDANGAAVADAEVKAVAMRDPDQPPQFPPWAKLSRTFTGVDGSFTVGELPTGTYALQARSLDGGESVLANVAAGSTGATIKLVRPGGIAGTLAGYPAPPVVYARPLGAGSERLIPGVVDGNAFRITGLRPGRYLVGAQTTYEGDARVVEIRVGETARVALTARGRGTVEGTVLDFRTRAPLPNARCHAVMAIDGEQTVTNWDLSTAAASDAQGRVVLDPAPAGSINVSCAIPGAKWSTASADVALAPGGRATVQLLSVQLANENGASTGMAFDWRVTAPRVSQLAPDSPAAKAGLAVGDVITAVNGQRVDGLNGPGVYFLISSLGVGAEVSLGLARGKTVTFTLGSHAD